MDLITAKPPRIYPVGQASWPQTPSHEVVHLTNKGAHAWKGLLTCHEMENNAPRSRLEAAGQQFAALRVTVHPPREPGRLAAAGVLHQIQSGGNVQQARWSAGVTREAPTQTNTVLSCAGSTTARCSDYRGTTLDDTDILFSRGWLMMKCEHRESLS